MALKTKLVALAAASAAAAAMAAGAPALASSHGASSHGASSHSGGAITTLTGPEVVSGTVHGREALINHPVIPLRWRGLLYTHSIVRLSGSGTREGDVKSLRSPDGKLTVLITHKPQSRQFFDDRTCRFSYVQDIQLKVLGRRSTRMFAGASGPGAVQVLFSGYVPRYKHGPKKGQCSHGTPLRKGARATFLVSMVLTLR
ncbi:MAG: hypothetical protein ACLP7J_19955 [Streptosporangiaceae bacterium]